MDQLLDLFRSINISHYKYWGGKSAIHQLTHVRHSQFVSGVAAFTKTKAARQQFDNIKRGVLLISSYFTFVTVICL